MQRDRDAELPHWAFWQCWHGGEKSSQGSCLSQKYLSQPVFIEVLYKQKNNLYQKVYFFANILRTEQLVLQTSCRAVGLESSVDFSHCDLAESGEGFCEIDSINSYHTPNRLFSSLFCSSLRHVANQMSASFSATFALSVFPMLP